MDTRHLRAFVAVAEELHFSRAADRLGVSQPQLSQQIRKLERELNATLFDRSTRSVRLTDAGSAALEPARALLRDADAVRHAALVGRSEVFGRVTIGYAGASSREILPRLARAVRSEHPGIELALQSLVYGGTAPAQVAAGTVDIGFSRLPVRRTDVNSRVVVYERVVVALPADHPLAAGATVRVKDLADEPFVTFPATQGSTVRDAMMRVTAAHGFTPRVLQEAPDSYAILGLVAAGMGVTITVSSVQHIDTPGLVYRDLAGSPMHLAAVIVWRKNENSTAVHAVLEVMEEIIPTPADTPRHVLV
ncbi:LysR family transcriptional regulator [Kocuria sp. NPDC057446]|uniref:LysR family transcriptional regulator n=1 Tax=Kocuria sp. NPDC057446 TaxID=3346137 RepID=UPI00369437F2